MIERNYARHKEKAPSKRTGRYGWAGVSAKVPDEVEAERRRAIEADRTPNMIALGDPLPGRSALERRNAEC